MTPLKPNAMKSMQIIRNAVLLLSLITLGPLSSTAVTPSIVSSPGEKASVVENPAMTTAPTAIAAHPVETPSSLTLEELCKGRDELSAGKPIRADPAIRTVQPEQCEQGIPAAVFPLGQSDLPDRRNQDSGKTIPGVDIPTLNKDQYQALVELIR